MTRAASRSWRCCCGWTEQIARLEKRVALQDERIARLERRDQAPSRNSSQRPSQNPPTAPKRGMGRSGRSAGGQPGHEGKGRPFLAACCRRRLTTAQTLTTPASPVACRTGRIADRVTSSLPPQDQMTKRITTRATAMTRAMMAIVRVSIVCSEPVGTNCRHYSVSPIGSQTPPIGSICRRVNTMPRDPSTGAQCRKSPM